MIRYRPFVLQHLVATLDRGVSAKCALSVSLRLGGVWSPAHMRCVENLNIN